MAATKVLIDPGHAPGNANGGKNGYKEYAGMWKLSNYLKTALMRSGIQADLTRTETQDPSLSARGQAAKGYNLFISEHSNAGGGKGVECFYSVSLPADKANAARLSKAVAEVMNTTDRGAKTRESTETKGADYYTVIDSARRTGCLHVFLIENGFHDNAQDEAFLLLDGNLKKIAERQAEVICSILGVPFVANQSEHWAETDFVYLNNIGVTIHERRFEHAITRGEVFALAARIVKLFINLMKE